LSDRIFSIVAVAGLAVLAFFAGGFVVLAQVFPYPQLRDAYVAGKALIAQRSEAASAYATDLWREARTDARGVTVHDATRTQPGYTLYSSGHDQRAYLIALDGRVLHEWHMPYSEVWDETAAPREPVPDDHTYFRQLQLFPNGDLLVVYDGVGDTPHGYGLVRLDRDSQVLWKYLQRAHHAFDVAPDGRVYTLTHEITSDVFEPRTNLGPPRIDDFVVELSADGTELRKLRLLETLAQSDYLRMLDTLPGYLGESGDYLHTNDIVYVDAETAAHFEFLQPGQVLVSMREPGALAAVDLDHGRVTWAIRGAWVGQHDPDLLPNGRILLFDNNGDFGPSGRSQILELDPRNQHIVWRYRGDAQRPLESVIRSDQQRLPNGNTLISESDGGRILEVAADGAIVWEFVNPIRGGPTNALIPVIDGAQRIDPAQLEPGFRQTLEAALRRSSA
jgi:hypothetical protein